jgi:hypothetical protein
MPPPLPPHLPRFERWPRLTIALIVAALVLAVEGCLRVGYWLLADRPDADQAALLRGDGIEDVTRFWRELELINKDRMQYHPYRWYALPPSVTGRYHSTDRFGFRSDGRPLDPRTQKIGFFGGSTMYSVRTTAEDSIPGIVNQSLDRSRVEAVNYGLGAYSSTAELMTFIEVTRRPDAGIRWAVFLDGVNEVSRFGEKWQAQADAPFYDVMGYRWESTRYGLRRELGAPVRARFAIGRAVDWLADRMERARRAPARPPSDHEYGRAGEAIAQIYFHNLEDIRALAVAKSIVPIFALQPTIFDVAHPSPREQAIRRRASDHQIDVGKLYRSAYDAIVKDPRFAAFHVHDLRDALNGRGTTGEIFFDDCHLNRAGNALLAARIRTWLPG